MGTRPFPRGRALVAVVFVCVLFASLVTAPARGAQAVDIQLLTHVGFRPLDYSLARGSAVTVRISGALPDGFRVFNDRPDGRAGVDTGPNRLGREVTQLFELVSPAAYEAHFTVLLGVNSVVVTSSNLAPLAVATMLSYGDAYEDVNGNGVLDADEDVNKNQVLDRGEDRNGNELLDAGEDRNGNGVLTPTEDLDSSRQLDRGEDFNGNGRIDPLSSGVTAELATSPSDFATIAGTQVRYSVRSVHLSFASSTTDVDASDLLRSERLRPVGVLVDDTSDGPVVACGLSRQPPRVCERGRARVVTGTVPGDEDALQLVRRLNLLPPAAPGFFPDARPVRPPLDVAVPVFVMPPPETSSEAMPARLRRGATAPPGAGNAGDVYNAANGGFDNDNDGPFDELDISWHHFFMETFAGHRLVEKLTSGVSGPQRPVVAIVDTGLGDGSGSPLVDIEARRIVNPTDCSVAGPCTPKPVRDIPDEWTTGQMKGDHGTSVTHLAMGAGQRVLGIAKDANVRPIKPRSTGEHELRSAGVRGKCPLGWDDDGV
jgi:hypothetical protein